MWPLCWSLKQVDSPANVGWSALVKSTANQRSQMTPGSSTYPPFARAFCHTAYKTSCFEGGGEIAPHITLESGPLGDFELEVVDFFRRDTTQVGSKERSWGRLCERTAIPPMFNELHRRGLKFPTLHHRLKLICTRSGHVSITHVNQLLDAKAVLLTRISNRQGRSCQDYCQCQW